MTTINGDKKILKSKIIYPFTKVPNCPWRRGSEGSPMVNIYLCEVVISLYITGPIIHVLVDIL